VRTQFSKEQEDYLEQRDQEINEINQAKAKVDAGASELEARYQETPEGAERRA
jgi:hypothetical protein